MESGDSVRTSFHKDGIIDNRHHGEDFGNPWKLLFQLEVYIKVSTSVGICIFCWQIRCIAMMVYCHLSVFPLLSQDERS